MTYAEEPGRTTLTDPAIRYTVPDRPYVVLRRDEVEAVVVDHRAVDDATLPGHRAGYSGLAALKHARRPENLFVPAYAGLNFEHIHDGTTQDRDVLYEPRRAPMELRYVDEHTAELYQAPTPHWGLESCQRFQLLPDRAIEMTLECIPRRRSSRNGYIGLFWASYIATPESPAIYFPGHPCGGEPTPRWIEAVSPAHGALSTHLAADDRRDFLHDPDFPMTLVFNRSQYRYSEPWSYGVSHGMAFVQVFRAGDQVRMTQSPSGGGAGNPAWDFQYFIPDYEVGRCYRLVMRALYLPYESPEQVRRAIAPHRTALERPDRDLDRAERGRLPSNAEAVCGTWVLQQVDSREELDHLLPAVLAPALSTPGVRGFSMRVPWRAIDADFALLESGLAVARQRGLDFSVRFMAGRHTPARVFAAGCPSYRHRGERVPVPFFPDGSPNTLFEAEYERFVARLAGWCRAHGVRLLHLAWYGQDWAELNHGKEVRAQPGYSYENWLKAHTRLLDIGLKSADESLAVELPFSGYGPLTEAAVALADHVVERIGPANPVFFCQANGWGPAGDWGAPDARTEAAFDAVWRRPICRGQQAIQPGDYEWAALYRRLAENRATYGEVYAPSFTRPRGAQLAEEVRKFADRCREEVPLPPPDATPRGG